MTYTTRGAEEPGNRPATEDHGRPLRLLQGRQGRHRRPRDPGRRRQRRRLPDDQRELPLELIPVEATPRLSSLYVEPERPPEDARAAGARADRRLQDLPLRRDRDGRPARARPEGRSRARWSPSSARPAAARARCSRSRRRWTCRRRATSGSTGARWRGSTRPSSPHPGAARWRSSSSRTTCGQRSRLARTSRLSVRVSPVVDRDPDEAADEALAIFGLESRARQHSGPPLRRGAAAGRDRGRRRTPAATRARRRADRRARRRERVDSSSTPCACSATAYQSAVVLITHSRRGRRRRATGWSRSPTAGWSR